MKNLAQTAPFVAPDCYDYEAPETPLHLDYEPTPAERLEAERLYAVMDAERVLGLELAPTEADQRWWADQQDTLEARAAAEDAIDRADRERYELDELDRLLRERRYDVNERRGFGPGHMSEGGWTVMADQQTCGYCRGSGRVPGPKFDREGRHRPEWPDWITCEYCCGSGSCEEGEKLSPARPFVRYHAHSRACYDDAGPGRGGVSTICGKIEGEPEAG